MKIHIILLFVAASLTAFGYTYKKTVLHESYSLAVISKENMIEETSMESVKAEKDEIRLMVDNMTLDEKIGQMIIAGFYGTEVNEDIKDMIAQHHIGGIILFSRNIDNSRRLSALISDLNKANGVNNLPLFISVDEEGGRVTRLPAGNFPSARSIGSENNAELSYRIGQDIGTALKYYGFNMDFAPVMDIDSNPDNPVIGDRSFGNNPLTVYTHGIEIMRGLQSRGIIPVIKHFPGHGDTGVDSHTDLPVVYHDIDRLNNFELIPFYEAINRGADAVMTAHIEFPKIDASGTPATLSHKILTGLLREQLGFKGVVITDDMEMGAIDNNYGIEEAAVRAVSAGTDILLICHSADKQKEAINALKEAVKAGHISPARIDESIDRIIKLKQKYMLQKFPS